MPESIALDHVVIAVHDLAKAIDDYRALGFNVFPGGEHRHRGSRNALITFRDGSYIELIAFRHEPPVKDNDWWDLLQRGEGLVDVAVIVPNVDIVVDRLSAAGIQTPDIVAGGRDTPEGHRIAWRVARASRALRLPFFIDDVTDRALRVPVDGRATHANGATGIAGVTVATDRLAEAAAAYDIVFGQEGPHIVFGDQAIDLEQSIAAEAGIRRVSLRGGHATEFWSPARLHGASLSFQTHDEQDITV